MPFEPLIFLDLDDVLCLNDPYGGYDVVTRPYPEDLWQKLFSSCATSVLLEAVREHRPRFVLTTSWLMFLERAGFESLFRATGLTAVADCLHESWEAPQDRGMSRLQAIERWLRRFSRGEPFVVLDDSFSGTGLIGSRIQKARRLVLCEIGVGLHSSHLAAIHRALQTPTGRCLDV